MRKQCSECHYSHVCSEARKDRHDGTCEQFNRKERYAFYPGGSPPIKFCPLCKHVDDKCISEADISTYAMNRRVDKDKLKEQLLSNGYVLTDYRIIEGACMTHCNRFEEID